MHSFSWKLSLRCWILPAAISALLLGASPMSSGQEGITRAGLHALRSVSGQAQAPVADLSGGIAWLNTAKPISLADLRGRVVLLDFWTLC